MQGLTRSCRESNSQHCKAIRHYRLLFYMLQAVNTFRPRSGTLQPLAGKLYIFFRKKFVFLTFLFVFEIGSLICALANSSSMLIAGRAVAGAGSSGLMNGAWTIVGTSVPLAQQPCERPCPPLAYFPCLIALTWRCQ